MATLLDTDVLSELLRDRPEPAVTAWVAQRSRRTLFTSAITQAEMLLGLRLLPEGKRRKLLGDGIDAMFEHDFDSRVLVFDSRAADAFADIVATRRAAGKPISHFDAQIAAIAVAHRLDVATRDVDDFVGCGVVVVNPWQDRTRAATAPAPAIASPAPRPAPAGPPSPAAGRRRSGRR